ncbi:hypothetical protein [Dyella sp. EPa41]|uniref:hypothetical protein n=1 Tax=Dyella sp. EPa41 TaxID=1561194 RepID=UPI00191581BD|nr:hypothetical protein [Dyella sp. EPa41]
MHALSIARTCLCATLMAATCASAQQAKPPPIAIHSVNVDFPASTTAFPPGPGSDIAGKCLICHSAGMVLRQPALSRDQWKSEINKMRTVYGAPILDAEVEPLSAYFTEVTRQRQ